MSTLRISISFEHEPIELDILSDKLTWSNLVTFIDSMHAMEAPVILYYKKDTEIETLQNQDQLTQLLIPNIRGLRFYAQKELVAKPVYILPGSNAFSTLAQFVEENKSVIESSHHLARSVGMLAFFIAQDTTKDKFEHEFEALENLVTRKSKRREPKQAEETSEDQQEEDPRETLFGGRGDCHFGRRRGGHHFGGRGGHHFGGRGAFGPAKAFGGHGGHGRHFGGHGGPSGNFDGPFSGGSFGGGPFGGGPFGGGPFGDGPFGDGPFGYTSSSDTEELDPFGNLEGFGKHARGFHGRGRFGPFGGGPFSGRPFGYTSSSDTEELDPFGNVEGFGKHTRGFHGRGRFGPFGKHGKRGKLGRCGKFDGSFKDSFTKDEKLAWKMHLLKKLQRRQGCMKNDNHFHFA